VYHCARNYLTFAANSIPVGGGDEKDSENAILYSRLSGLIVCSCSAVEKAECQKVEIKRELQSFLMQAEAVINKSPQELIESLHAICEGLQELIQSPPLAANCGETGKMDIDEECKTSLAVRLGVHITVWEFVLPITPSLPAVFGVSNVE
jgi:hypothetical protein